MPEDDEKPVLRNRQENYDRNLFYEKDKLRGLVPTSDNGRADEVYATYLEGIQVESDPDVQVALAMSQDPRFRRFLELMSSPGRFVKVQTVAKQCGIDLVEFANFYSKASVQMAIARAQRRAAGIVDDMAGDARTQSEYCPKCEGYGWVQAPANLPVDTPGYRILMMQTGKDGAELPFWCRTCPQCQGKQRVNVPGDEHSRDKVLEIAGLVQKGNKGGVQIVQNFGGSSHTSAVTGSLESLTVDVSAEVPDGDGL